MKKNTTNKKLKSSSRFQVVEKKGNAHGGLFELEIDLIYEVLDTKTNKVVQTYKGEHSASYGRDGSGWDDGTCQGVSKVEISDDEKYVLVYFGSDKVKKVKLPT